jgi:hypothetical protein
MTRRAEKTSHPTAIWGTQVSETLSTGSRLVTDDYPYYTTNTALMF